ncbi:DNA-binding protein RFX8 isoform X7 [Elephas maximus indicus]|nr:DNA-binding protein RFX8 isoform X7 [Elephas maximus indicus]
MAFLADEYRNYCQDILQIVRNQELERVGDFLTSFWKSLQQDTVMFMSLPDVCQLLKCYDVQLYKASGSKEEFIKLAASFQLRWNFLLTAVSKAMTLCHRDSFGSWHLFHLLLLEYVIHVLQSSVEEDVENLDEVLSDDQSLIQPHQALFYPPDSSPTQECESPRGEPPQLMLKHTSQSWCAAGLSSMTLRVLGFLVDTATGNQLIQVLLEDGETENTVRLSLPVGQEALITLRDGQKFVMHVSDVPQSSEHIYFRESNANM